MSFKPLLILTFAFALSLPSATQADFKERATVKYYKTVDWIIRHLGFKLDELVEKKLGIQVLDCTYQRFQEGKPGKKFHHGKLGSCVYQNLREGFYSNDYPGKVFAQVRWPNDKEDAIPTDVEIRWNPSIKDVEIPWYRPDKKIYFAVKYLTDQALIISSKNPIPISRFIRNESLLKVLGSLKKDARFTRVQIVTKGKRIRTKKGIQTIIYGVAGVYNRFQRTHLLKTDFMMDLNFTLITVKKIGKVEFTVPTFKTEFEYEVGKDFEDDLIEVEEL